MEFCLFGEFFTSDKDIFGKSCDMFRFFLHVFSVALNVPATKNKSSACLTNHAEPQEQNTFANARAYPTGPPLILSFRRGSSAALRICLIHAGETLKRSAISFTDLSSSRYNFAIVFSRRESQGFIRTPTPAGVPWVHWGEYGSPPMAPFQPSSLYLGQTAPKRAPPLSKT